MQVNPVQNLPPSTPELREPHEVAPPLARGTLALNDGSKVISFVAPNVVGADALREVRFEYAGT